MSQVIVDIVGESPGRLRVDSLNQDAQGVARSVDGKVVFIEGALPSEHVEADIHRRKNGWEQGVLTVIHQASAQRVEPACPHFGLHLGACGGCKLQHLHVAAQVSVKQRSLEDDLWHLGKVRPDQVLRPIEGPAWGYRYRARLSVRRVRDRVLIGFHERKSRYVADMRVCPVLPPHVSAMLMPLRELVASLDAVATCPQLELACGDDVTAWVLRHLEPLSQSDLTRLRAFAQNHPTVQWWLQPKGPETAHLLDPDPRPLRYGLPEFGVAIAFRPTDFTQVNLHINRALVSRAIRSLGIRPEDRIIDWFCGLGNFTLPIATQAGSVVGVEGSASLVSRARANAEANRWAGRKLTNIEFIAQNLFETTPEALLDHGVADQWLVDPPREGAWSLVRALAHLNQEGAGVGALSAWRAPRRIVYVSCNPATLARDAGLLVHQAGYRCSAVGVMNMFAHTTHVESMAVFDRVDGPS